MLKKMLFIFMTGCLLVAFNVPQSFADSKYDIKEMTPEVQKALDNRRERFEQLKAFKAKGMIGENNQGYTEALSANVDVQILVKAENQDRKVIYETIAQQNNLTEAMATIQEVFAQVQRDKAQPGEKIQNKDGTWVEK